MDEQVCHVGLPPSTGWGRVDRGGVWKQGKRRRVLVLDVCTGARFEAQKH